jgi:indole-3-glycerol phosphate synthase
MILDEIVANKRIELENFKRALPLREIMFLVQKQPPPKDFAMALKGDNIRLIAEVKKASPSKGLICPEFDAVKIAGIYADNGASVISVLTESKFFQGSLNDLRNIARTLGKNRPPLLRKDFIFDPYQVYEARAFGADAILLIVAVLSPNQLNELLTLSHSLGMKCLVEIHNEKEMDVALGSQAGIIGINNRDLKTFHVNITTTQLLRKRIPQERIVVSESGIKTRADMEKMREWGVHAVLIGEALMTAPDIAAKIRELL